MAASINATFGAYLLGVIMSAILYGVTMVQTWFYYLGYPADPWHIKTLVLAVFISDTIHQALITHSAYVYLVTDITAPTQLGSIVCCLIVEVLFNAITAFLVQCFLTMRVYRLSNKSIIATVSVLIVVTAQFVMSVIYVSKSISFTTFAQLETLKTLSSAINATTAVSDVMIAACLCFLLQKSRTGFRRSDNMINKLIIFSINTGLMTSLFAIASLVSISVRPDAFIYIAFYFCLGRMYCNSLLATLNARRIIRGDSTDDDMSMSLQGVTKKTTTQSVIGTTQRPMPNNISIKIDTTQELVRDEIHDEYSASSTEMKLPV
ncbi:hypothetical protein SCLCIDRAFT_1209960 [Scleroderma citrinum Foug A]|uniref:DUF6534 domain-containing protein n=1 Tax=Scleroderma citrinum Foug A TaxID=1036808 RepID=A0A0C3EIR3_9AGAM|nr:hypothetical protein SCLCIDRAFT_1209960 [Scleroderma citrinum Foug A]